MTRPSRMQARRTGFFTGPLPRLFAHRGASGEAPENTLVAFRRAIALGVAYAELDVHATRDGQVVVIHDPTVERTTNGQGRVQDYTLAELQRLDAGYRFSPDNGQTYPFRACGVTIPTLQEVLRACPELRFTIEIKQADPPIEELVLAAVQECDRTAEVLLASEHDQVLARVRTLAPHVATSFAVGEGWELFQRIVTGQLAGYRPPGQALQAPLQFRGVLLITPQTVTAAHDLGLEVHVWTINDPQEMEQLFALGVDGIMSDFPARLLEVAQRYQAWEH
ncbi:MAG: glycerophosphodiester phosphodiesterase [Candidatus Binatia bacterium]|nr:glycerophosphodiester phosphodiesterase [Candidatus Binatia bacterium]